MSLILPCSQRRPLPCLPILISVLTHSIVSPLSRISSPLLPLFSLTPPLSSASSSAAPSTAPKAHTPSSSPIPNASPSNHSYTRPNPSAPPSFGTLSSRGASCASQRPSSGSCTRLGSCIGIKADNVLLIPDPDCFKRTNGLPAEMGDVEAEDIFLRGWERD